MLVMILQSQIPSLHSIVDEISYQRERAERNSALLGELRNEHGRNKNNIHEGRIGGLGEPPYNFAQKYESRRKDVGAEAYASHIGKQKMGENGDRVKYDLKGVEQVDKIGTADVAESKGGKAVRRVRVNQHGVKEELRLYDGPVPRMHSSDRIKHAPSDLFAPYRGGGMNPNLDPHTEVLQRRVQSQPGSHENHPVKKNLPWIRRQHDLIVSRPRINIKALMYSGRFSRSHTQAANVDGGKIVADSVGCTSVTLWTHTLHACMPLSNAQLPSSVECLRPDQHNAITCMATNIQVNAANIYVADGGELVEDVLGRPEINEIPHYKSRAVVGGCRCMPSTYENIMYNGNYLSSILASVSESDRIECTWVL